MSIFTWVRQSLPLNCPKCITRHSVKYSTILHTVSVYPHWQSSSLWARVATVIKVVCQRFRSWELKNRFNEPFFKRVVNRQLFFKGTYSLNQGSTPQLGNISKTWTNNCSRYKITRVDSKELYKELIHFDKRVEE